ncbi:glucose dehydrogenase [Neolewinella marina]|uniref:Glucose dehydrogenase n=1 Tax=Neolewinella marina TaxID=438751 RepID=A0A2G0CHM2_9BACT|nr:glucose dehydrogenase [Neolewinella marina]
MRILWVGLLACTLAGCYRILPSKGGGQLADPPERRFTEPAHVRLPEGYRIEVVAEGLTYPTAITFDEAGTPYVVEAGYAYGEVFLEPRLLRIDPTAGLMPVYTGSRNGPWNGVTFHQGYFYVAEGGQLEGGRILRISQDGAVEVLVDNLPSRGDHHTNGPLIQNGYLYFGQGTATNAGVVGNDNADYGWLQRFPDFHDVPCADITVTGHNYTTDNVLTADPNDRAVTGPYSPYNQSVEAGQLIPGAVPCNGAILRVPLTGGKPEVVAWGVRNPYGLAFSPDGELYVTDNLYDVRGSRPIWGTGDLLWKIEAGQWYGWPDFYKGIPVERLEFPGGQARQPVLQNHPNKPPPAVASFGVHASACGLDFARGAAFGFPGQAFVAQFGDLAPAVGKVLAPVGYQIARVNVQTGVVEPFAINQGKKHGPASYLRSGGFERPIDVQFDPSGNALYVVDFGTVTMNGSKPVPQPGTGVVWRISREE